ncbi:MAG: LysR family transcriptional regulator [Planctomycetes bacterium]|nr:LysR family transcriptional regulator [Planctomycetota bacterium]
MDSLNYHHLMLFHAVVREGSVSAAARRLGLTPQTISMQVKELEDAVGEELLDRSGREVRPSAAGRIVFGYAERVFAAGEDLIDAVRSGVAARTTLLIGVSDGFPKAIASALVEPLLLAETAVRVTVDEGEPDHLLARLAAQEIDVVLSDAPAPTGFRTRVFNRLLGESGVSWAASPEVAHDLRPGFPGSMEGVPIVVPHRGHPLRTHIDGWIDAGLDTRADVGSAVRPDIPRGRPRIVAEVADQALAIALAQSGAAVAPVPHVVLRAEGARLGLRRVGRIAGFRERFYVITPERRLRHPAITELAESARRALFRGGDARG